MKLLQILALLTVLILDVLVLDFATAKGSAYAVFKVSYSETSSDVAGGVAGTAFFVAKETVISAYHVLNSSSFKPNAGYLKARVWLVHEGETPIEIFEKNIQTDASKDITVVHLQDALVPAENIFSLQKSNLAFSGGPVESEGFRANSAGPILSWKNGAVEIDRVPQLERMKVSGIKLRETLVRVQSNDMQLWDAPGIQVSYEPVIGLSGGPVVQNNTIIGFNSFADPSHKSSWVIALNQP